MRKTILALAILCLLVIPSLAMASDSENLTEEQIAAKNEINMYLGRITSLITGIGGTLGTIVLTVGGVMFMTSADNPERRDQAKNIIQMGIVGLVVILVAPLVVRYIFAM